MVYRMGSAPSNKSSGAIIIAIDTGCCWATVTGSDKGHWAKDCIRDGRVQSRGVPVAALVSGGTERKLCGCAGGYWDLTVSQ